MKYPRQPPITHGVIPPLERLTGAKKQVRDLNEGIEMPFSFAVTGDTSRFDYLLPQLQTRDALLPETPAMHGLLRDLGNSMVEPEDQPPRPDSSIPSAYTYFGQYLDHDVTFEAKSEQMVKLSDDVFRVLTPEEIRTRIINGRTPGVDLDNVYSQPAPRDRSRMVLGFVQGPGGRPTGLANDLPRKPRNEKDPKEDRAALIGDKRNDENLVIAQLHVAFLRAHNAIVNRGCTFDEARQLLRQHYQWIVIKDFLPRICDPLIVNEILFGGNKFFRPHPDDLFMPFEFSVAAYRFGHSMVREAYHYNRNFQHAGLLDLFMLTAFSGRLRDADRLPESWIIEWKNFLDGGLNFARPIDTALSRELFDLRSFGKPMPIPVEARLPVRNLLRGYMLRLPVGQAVAKALDLQVMDPAEIEQVAQSVSEEQLAAIRAGDFARRTPLWYYILAEAATAPFGRLGPVGSTIVAEVLIGLIRGSKDSILRKKDWKPTLGPVPGRFTLRDLLGLAGVLTETPDPTLGRRMKMSTRIIDKARAKRAEMMKDPALAGVNMTMAVAAIKGGIRSPEWRAYMMQFVEQDPPGTPVDPRRLDRLLGTDNTLGDPVLDRRRAYLVGNGTCGPDTPVTFTLSVFSIDDGLDGGCGLATPASAVPRYRKRPTKRGAKRR